MNVCSKLSPSCPSAKLSEKKTSAYKHIEGQLTEFPWYSIPRWRFLTGGVTTVSSSCPDSIHFVAALVCTIVVVDSEKGAVLRTMSFVVAVQDVDSESLGEK